jgi:hypothetical protein
VSLISSETFEVDGLQVEVLEADRRQIHKVRFRRAQPQTWIRGELNQGISEELP